MTHASYRELYLWGDRRDSRLDESTLQFLEEQFGTQREQQRSIAESLKADESVVLAASKLPTEQLQGLRQRVGEANVLLGDFDRAQHGQGKFYADLLNLRHRRVPFPPDAVVTPQSHEQVQSVVDFCHQQRLPIIPYGGGTSVTRGLEATHGGVSIDLGRRLNRVIELNEHNQTVRVQAGILGPQLESYLNERGYTCGHFPQSFEYSTIGGWIAANGAGQCSTGYGRASDLMVALKVATPLGSYQSKDFPAAAQGWDLNRLFAGSEGVLGVITEVTWRVFKYRPANRRRASFLFRDFPSAVEALREMIQAEAGRPHLFRVSDGPETRFGFRLKGFEGTWRDKLLRGLGYLPPERSTMLMMVEGDERYTQGVQRRLRSIARQHGAFPAGRSPVDKWLDQRFSSSYLRDAFMDAGYLIDTMETSVPWDRLLPVWQAAHRYFQMSPRHVFGMTHISHLYPDGCNLYAIFMAPMQPLAVDEQLQQFHDFQQGLIRTFVEHGGSISHHHGAGRMGQDFMAGQLGQVGMRILNGIKRVLDPHGIMNPGGTLGLDN